MNTLKQYTIKGFISVFIIGTIWHFVYEWSGNNFFLGFLFPINESTWEHMKLCFFPMLIYAFYMNRKLKYEYPSVTSSLLWGVLLNTFLMPVFYYTYSGILGKNYTFLDISTFIVSTLVAFIAIYKFTLSCKLVSHTNLLKSLLLIVTICFLVFTYLPLNIGIFIPPN